MTNVLFLSEMDSKGSGYTAITENLSKGLAELGHKVIVLAFSYKNEEHGFPISVLPIENESDALASIHNLMNMPEVARPDLFIVALDIPWQERLLPNLKKYNVPYIGIMPLESDPLCFSWAAMLMGMDKVFFISQFGADEAQKQGVPAEHLQLGVDTEAWRMPTPEERKNLRLAFFGVEDDETFIILTVADNQERKNLSAAMNIISKFRHEEGIENFRYVLVTRPKQSIGWRLQDMASTYKIADRYIEFDRTKGIPFKELWAMYACADVFLLTSKGEGFGFPVVEAMSVGVPVVGTEAGAIIEHLTRGGGWMIEPEYVPPLDPYGNSNRYYISIDDAVAALLAVHSKLDVEDAVKKAREYVESRIWDIPVKQLDSAVKELTDGQTTGN